MDNNSLMKCLFAGIKNEQAISQVLPRISKVFFYSVQIQTVYLKPSYIYSYVIIFVYIYIFITKG